jgi:hypothetical protein
MLMDRSGALSFDRSAEDAGNILSLEHCNLRIPDQRAATVFYVEGLGLTRDPYMHTTDRNMWINAGRNQFHMPANETAQVLRGLIGLVVPHFDLARKGLAHVATKLSGTHFSWHDEGDTLRATCPWGNHFRIHAAGSCARMVLGIPYLSFPVPRGAAAGIRRFYATVMRARTAHALIDGDEVAEVQVGIDQRLRFFETDAPIAAYDGHHVAIYVADFSGPHQWLASRGLVTEESDACQYRFESIVDPDTGRVLFELEHEVRSLSHPMYPRHLSLVNRNPEQTQLGYQTGRDAWYAPPTLR